MPPVGPPGSINPDPGATTISKLGEAALLLPVGPFPEAGSPGEPAQAYLSCCLLTWLPASVAMATC